MEISGTDKKEIIYKLYDALGNCDTQKIKEHYELIIKLLSSSEGSLHSSEGH